MSENDPRPTPLSRRRLLALAGAGAIATAAGCGGDGDGGDGDTSTTPGATSTRAATTAPATSTTAAPTSTATTTEETTPAPTTTAGAPADAGSYVDLDDGFATPAPWLETEDPRILTVSHPTKDALESALAVPGPRVIVFETSGTIDLEWSDVETGDGQCWIAGQTAPSPGINLIRGTVFVSGDDSVVQHIRVRRGERSGPGEGKDAISTGDDTSNNVLDHVSAYWGRDENLSVGYRSTNTTVANCLVAEGLSEPAENNNGSLIGNNADGVALLGTTYAQTLDRNPRLKDQTRSVVVNTLCHHFNEACNMSGGAQTSFEGNVYLRTRDPNDAVVDGDGAAHVADNIVDEPPLDGSLVGEPVTVANSRPIWPEGFEPMPAADVEAHHLRYAGARPADRDAHDERIVQQIRDRSGDFIGKQGDVGGWTILDQNTHTLDVPEDGLREWLEGWALSVEEPDVEPP